MTSRQGALKWLTNPWVALGLLLLGLALGTWLPTVAEPFAWLVGQLVKGLVFLAPFIILFTILPALLTLFDIGVGRAPVVVILLFSATTIVAGVFAVFVAWLAFGLPIAAPDVVSSGGILSNLGGNIFGSRPFIAVLWAFGSAALLHVLKVIGRRRGIDGSNPSEGGLLGRVIYAGEQTANVFRIIGGPGVEKVGRGLEYALPLLLFAVGTFVPRAVDDAATQVAEAASASDALPIYLGAAALVGIVTTAYILVVGVVATKLTRTSFRKAITTYFPPVYAFAWATSSSAATIPINLEAAERGLDVRTSTREFVIPLGATINLDGTMIAAMIITPVVMATLGLTMTIGQLAATLVPLVFLTVGAPGIPGGLSFLAPPTLATILGLSGSTETAFIGLWVAFSLGLTDQFRTAVNSVNNGFLCLIVEKLLGMRSNIVLEEIDAVPDAAAEADAR